MAFWKTGQIERRWETWIPNSAEPPSEQKQLLISSLKRLPSLIWRACNDFSWGSDLAGEWRSSSRPIPIISLRCYTYNQPLSSPSGTKGAGYKAWPSKLSHTCQNNYQILPIYTDGNLGNKNMYGNGFYCNGSKTKLTGKLSPTEFFDVGSLIVLSLGLTQMNRLWKFNMMCVCVNSSGTWTISIELWLLNRFPDFSLFPSPALLEWKKRPGHY